MSDLALCNGVNCSKRLECYRFMAKRNEYRNTFCDFERICGEWNQWKYIYDIDDKEVREVKEELQETTKTTEGEVQQ